MRIARALAACWVLAVAMTIAERSDAADEDVVRLKDGTTLTGKILDEDPKGGVTIKLSSGKVQVVPVAQVKSTTRADVAPKKEAPPDEPPAPRRAPPPTAAPPRAVDERDSERRALFGAGGDLGLVLSSNNADGAIKLLSPSLGAHVTLAGSATASVYFLLDVGLSTFSRRSTVSQPARIDTTKTPLVVTNQEISTKNRAILLLLAPQAGYELTRSLSARVGLLLGYARTSASAEAPLHACEADAQGGVTYGARLVPLAYRGLGNVELSATLDYLWAPMPRCFVPGLDKGLTIKGGGVTEISPSIQKKTLAVGVLGVGATYSFR